VQRIGFHEVGCTKRPVFVGLVNELKEKGSFPILNFPQRYVRHVMKGSFLDNILFGMLPRQSNNLLADAWFKRHLYRPTVPLIVPTIEGEKCMTMAYLLASPHPHNQPGSGMID